MTFALTIAFAGCNAGRAIEGSAWLETGGQPRPLAAMPVYLCDRSVFEGEYLLKSVPGGMPKINHGLVVAEGRQLEAIAQKSCAKTATRIDGSYSFTGVREDQEVFAFHETPLFATYWKLPVAEKVDLHSGNATDSAYSQ